MTTSFEEQILLALAEQCKEHGYSILAITIVEMMNIILNKKQTPNMLLGVLTYRSDHG